MNFIFIRETKKNTSKLKAHGSTLKLLTFLTIIAKFVVEQIMKDYDIDFNTALKLVTDSITEAAKTVKEVEDIKC